MVANMADGQRGIEMEILGLELLATQGDQEFINYDSRNKVANRGGAMTGEFDKLIGGKIYYLVSADNKVAKVEGIKELFDRAEPPTDPNVGGGAPGAGARRGAAADGAATNAPQSFSAPMRQNVSVKLLEIKPIGG